MNKFRSNWCSRWSVGIVLLGVLLISIPPTQGMTSGVETNSLFPTNSYWRPLPIDPAIYDKPFQVSLFDPQNGEDSARVSSQTKWVFLYGLGVLGVLWVLPEDLTGWDTDSDIFDKYSDNVHEGPAWDRDEWFINYVGHPYFGGVYYQVARKSGYRQWDSFVYSFLMSTFYWEYGIEAFAETPSIQDMVVHPLLGWVYGEWAYQTERKIRAADNEVGGSKVLGTISLAFLDPIDTLGRGINFITRHQLVNEGYGYLSYTSDPTDPTADQQIFLKMCFPLGGDNNEERPVPKYTENHYDPITSGTVGYSVGTRYALLNKDWGVDDDFLSQGSLGVYFTPSFSTRLNYAFGKLDVSSTQNTTIYENYNISSQYYFNSKRKLRPFISTGFGEQLWDKNRSNKIFQLHAGAGFHYKLRDKLALQTYWVNYYSPDEESNDQTFSAELVYRFAEGEHDLW